MIQVSDEMMDNARQLMAKGNHMAVGYRLMVKTVGAVTALEEFEKEKYPTLAAAGLESKTEEQKEKEERGTQYGIVVSIGDGAFKASALGGKNWVEEGDVVLFDRYAGIEIELPPGSKKMYRLMNDESLLGKMEAK